MSHRRRCDSHAVWAGHANCIGLFACDGFHRGLVAGLRSVGYKAPFKNPRLKSKPAMEPYFRRAFQCPIA